MSGYRVVFLQCDGPRCGESWGLSLDPGPLDRQRREANADGWRTRRPGGTDYCSQACEDAARINSGGQP